MYDAWSADPSRFDLRSMYNLTFTRLNLHINSVHASWAAYFANLEAGVNIEASFVGPPSLVGSAGSRISPSIAPQTAAAVALPSDSLGLSYLIRAYQMRGHEIANLDPLGINGFRDAKGPPELDYT